MPACEFNGESALGQLAAEEMILSIDAHCAEKTQLFDVHVSTKVP